MNPIKLDQVACFLKVSLYQARSQHCSMQVFATDANAQQIEQCKAQPNLLYQVAPAEDTKQADGSVDLVTVATAMHW